MRIFCFGIGYVGLALLRELQARGWAVGGTVRDPQKLSALPGAELYLWQDVPPVTTVLERFNHFLITIPPSIGGDPVLAAYGLTADDGKRSIPTFLTQARWLGYLSSTSVYGDCGGEWVDETAPVNPTSPHAQRRAAAEAEWMQLAEVCNLPLCVLRLSGIYGPGRSAIDRIRHGESQYIIQKPHHVFSRIHIDDIVGTIIASIERLAVNTCYNVADDLPANSAEVTMYAYKLLGVPAPPVITYDEALAAGLVSPMLQGFYQDHKQVCNRKLKQELNLTLKYPDYCSGLQGIVSHTSY